MNKIWNYGGRGYDFDITEASCVTRMAKALLQLKEDAERWEQRWFGQNGTPVSPDGALLDGTMIAEHCAEVRSFFDAMFGPGSGTAILGDSDSAQACDEAYMDFLCFAQMQVELFTRVREEVEARYRERLERMVHSQTAVNPEMAEAAEHGNSD